MITAKEDHVVLELNGVETVDLIDPEGARRGIVALQLHTGPPKQPCGWPLPRWQPIQGRRIKIWTQGLMRV